MAQRTMVAEARLSEAREATDQLFELLDPAAIYDRPIPERHRLIFYVGHLEAFDRNLLRGQGVIESPASDFDNLFAFGIDPVGGDLPDDLPQDWPRLATVLDYRDQVRAELDRAETRASGHLIDVAIEHRLMHLETLAYLFHQLPFAKKKGAAQRSRSGASSPAGGTIRIPAGTATLGLDRESRTFGWDNEFEEHTVHVPEFFIDRYKVTNGQFLQFVADGGYTNPAFWTQADTEWLADSNISHPVLWKRSGDHWLYRSMFDEIPLPLDWPVYVSYAEAMAWSRWAGKSLPSEAEWQRVAYGDGRGLHEVQTQQGSPVYRDPLPVHQCGSAGSPFGVEGLIGNGWEWNSTEFAPFPGFQAFACYPGYSEPFFDGKHFVLKGGSRQTAPCMLRPSFRNWFQPHYQYLYGGFRCVTREIPAK